jgi:DNA/RNA-binding domain of Phe-tRNA-synthetase-like protein
MPDVAMLEEFLAGGRVDAAVFALRPDYRVLLLAVGGIVPGPGDEDSDAQLRAAEAAAREALGDRPAEQLPRVAAWREAYRAFGAKPQRTRNSLEALLRRAASGLPRVNRLTDCYNAVSVLHQIPVGGEDLTRYTGPPQLVRATGTEAFDTVADGVTVTEHPDPGEVVWCDDAGVTCRRWNWRQARRTQLRDDTTTALFIFDALDPVQDQALHAAADDLTDRLTRPGPGVQAVRRLIRAGGLLTVLPAGPLFVYFQAAGVNYPQSEGAGHAQHPNEEIRSAAGGRGMRGRLSAVPGCQGRARPRRRVSNPGAHYRCPCSRVRHYAAA